MKNLLSLNTIHRLAGLRSFDRGENYFNLGLVRSLSEYNGTITAKVKGTHTYTVKLWVEDGELAYSCTCPIGNEGEFCKHCVAVGLTWLEQSADGKGKKAGRGGQAEVTMKDVKGYLETLEKNVLVEMVMQQAQQSDILREKLFMQAARKITGKGSLATLKKVIREAINPGDFIGYHGMRAYAERVHNVLDTLEDLLKDRHAAEVIELAEYTIMEAEIAIQTVDDSNGEMGDIFHRLQNLHLAACHKVKPNPEELAARLFDKELNGEWEVFYGAAKTYASVLGEKGLAVYRSLAEKEWKKIKPLGPNKKEREAHSPRRFNITHMMESLTEVSGDVDAMVEVKKKDLSYAYHYLQIAELYKKSGQTDRALEWAEAGIKAFPDRTDARLRDFLAAEYHCSKRHDEAMKLIWADFSDHARLENFKKLKGHAERIEQWPAWREKALDFIRKDIDRIKQKRSGRLEAWDFLGSQPLLVEIFLWEKDPDAAWQEAQAGGCSEQLWMKLAADREQNHPEDSIDVYKKWIDPTVNRKNNQAYEDAVKLIRKIQMLMNRLKRDAEFAGYLLGVRTTHKQKRNFMKLLDEIK